MMRPTPLHIDTDDRVQNYPRFLDGSSDSEPEPKSVEEMRKIMDKLRFNNENSSTSSSASKKRSAKIFSSEQHWVREQKRPTALMIAAMSGEVEAIDALIRDGSDIDARDERGRSALLLAAISGEENAVLKLLARNANPNTCDSTGKTVLMHTITAFARDGDSKYLDIIEDLFAKNANPFLRDKNGRTALMWAVVENCVPGVRAIIYSDKYTLNSKDNQGIAPLFYAVSKGYTEISRMLIEAGASVKVKNNHGIGIVVLKPKNADPIYMLNYGCRELAARKKAMRAKKNVSAHQTTLITEALRKIQISFAQLDKENLKPLFETLSSEEKTYCAGSTTQPYECQVECKTGFMRSAFKETAPPPKNQKITVRSLKLKTAKNGVVV